jgi:D-glycero-alpha-D-manno-heptose 1-phosphate guanylyltransferase
VECIILAGGMGTRLRSHVSDRPKPMADVAGLPFLQWQMESLAGRGVTKFVLAIGYLGDMIVSHFGTSYKGVEVQYSREESPLGTGGAVLQALGNVSSSKCWVTNGDTFCNLPLDKFVGFDDELVMGLIKLPSVERYGSVAHDVGSGMITEFLPKGIKVEGLINSGTYLLDRQKFLDRNLPTKFSLESDYLAAICKEGAIRGVACDVPFIDIGVPEDYVKAQTYIPNSAETF